MMAERSFKDETEIAYRLFETMDENPSNPMLQYVCKRTIERLDEDAVWAAVTRRHPDLIGLLEED